MLAGRAGTQQLHGLLSLQSDPEKHSQSMPKDGTVHEFTSNVCGCGAGGVKWTFGAVWR